MPENDPNAPAPGARDVIAGALTAAGFSAEEGSALLEQATAAARPAAPPAPRTVSTPAGSAAAKSYTIDEIRELGRALGIAGAPAAPSAPNGPPVTSRATPPPSSSATDDTPIMSMSEADKRALADKIGAKAFAERHLKELAKGRYRVRARGM